MNYLNRPDVRELLGVESATGFSSCSDPVFYGFVGHMDRFRVPTQFYVGGLLEVTLGHLVRCVSDSPRIHRY